MFKRRNALLLAMAVVVLAVGTFFIIRANSLSQDEAKKQFFSYAQNGFRGKFNQMENAFLCCFRKGDPASDYEEIFKTAQKVRFDPREHPTWEAIYRWEVKDNLDGCTFDVY